MPRPTKPPTSETTRAELLPARRGDLPPEGDWRARLYARLRARGYRSAMVLAAARPAVPARRLAGELGPDLVSAQLLRTLVAEAVASGAADWLARDLLARHLAGALDEGWPRSPSAAVYMRIAGALSRWIACLPEPWRGVARVAARTLLDAPPAPGWRPSGPDDAVIEAALARGAQIAPICA